MSNGQKLNRYCQAEKVLAERPADNNRQFLNAVMWIAGTGAPWRDLPERYGAKAVIPPTSNRKIQREYDNDIYKQRNLVEWLFNRFKQFRRIATRYEKTSRNYLDFVYFAAICIVL